MKLLMNSGGLATTNAFVVADEVAKVAVLFDAPDHTVAPLLDEIAKNGWDLIGLWLTHGHFDHLADHAVVTTRFPHAKLLIHRLDEKKLTNPRSAMFPLPFTIPPRSPDGYVEDGDVLEIGSLRAEVIFTPGHAPGHVMYYFREQNLLVGGDLIIGGAVGRTDLPDSSETDMVQSVRRVMMLPGETQLLPGHGGPSTLGAVMKTNDYVRAMVGDSRVG